MESGLRAAGTSAEALWLKKLAMQLPISGMIALERGFIFTSMILAAMTVALVEKRYRPASIWAFVAAILSATGLIHGFEIVDGSIINAYGPSHTWPFITGYAGMGIVFAVLGFNRSEKA